MTDTPKTTIEDLRSEVRRLQQIERSVLLWAERFKPGDSWDPEDLRDLKTAIGGTVEAHPEHRHQRRRTQQLKQRLEEIQAVIEETQTDRRDVAAQQLRLDAALADLDQQRDEVIHLLHLSTLTIRDIDDPCSVTGFIECPWHPGDRNHPEARL